MGKHQILFVMEGEKREIGIALNMAETFFAGKSDIKVISVPAEMNIYMLYRLMKQDDFETDIVELLRENVPDAKKVLHGYTRNDFAEVYYFFDFDEHSNNLNNTENVNALEEMLSRLDNETDAGKLYVSYPMVEALRDHSPFGCETISGDCFRHHDDFSTYKDDSSRVLDNNEIKGYRPPLEDSSKQLCL